MFVSAVDYVRRAWKGETNPVLATWILMTVVIGLSFWMYWNSPKFSWTGNIGLIAALFNIMIILTGVIATNLKNGTTGVAFNGVQLLCLVLGGVVFVFWLLTDQPLTAYVLVQCIALIAYAATVKRLWNSERSTEPQFLWTSVLLASLCALYPAWVKHELFAWIYLARAIPSTAVVIYLIARIKRQMVKVYA